MSPTILATKLFRPPTRPEIVARPRLLERLNAGLHRKLTLISAPAGFGKTTLVGDWLSSGDRAAAWLSLDEGDNDPTRFLAHLVAALQTIAPNLAGVSGALRSPQSPPAEAFLTALLNEVAAVPNAFTLVLDDYHVIDAPLVDDAVAFLLDHGPPQMHLVITTREDPPLPLARFRARGQLTELRAADLRFTSSEAAAFLREVMGLELRAEDVTLLETRTEGWIAGLQLAAISMQGHADAAGFIASFSGSHRFVLDYLVEEVLQQQSENVQRFLLHTSILGRMCGPLCDALLQDPAVPGQETLTAIEQANLFVVPLDDERRWYRYHHLFADLLQQRLQQRQASSAGAGVMAAAVLHARASQWFEDHGLRLEAFHHAAAADDVARAERLIEGDGTPLHFRGAATPVLNWLTRLPTSALDARPSLWVTYASASLFGGHATGVEQKLQAAEAALGSDVLGGDGLDERDRDLVGQIASLRATLAVMQNDVGAIMAQASRALEYLGPDNLTIRTAATWALGHAHQLAGDRAEAGRAFAEVLALGTSGDSIYTLAAAITAGHLQASELQLSLATKTYGRALELAGDPPHPMAAEAHLGLARTCYQRNDLGAADQHAERCRRLLRLMEKVPTVASYHMFKARLGLALGDVPGAVAALDEAAEYASERGFQFQLPEIAGLQVMTLLRQGDVAAAERLAEAHDLPLGRARVRLAQGDPAAALAVLEPWRRQVEERGWADERLKAMALQSLAHHANGALDAAARQLAAALALAEPGGLIRVFVDEGAAMADLLARVVAGGISVTVPANAEKLLAAFQAGDERSADEVHGPPAAGAQALDDPLSQRELEVLRLIAQGLSNREISERLFRALDTVKGYSRSIYGKLEVNSRTEAVARARDLGLL